MFSGTYNKVHQIMDYLSDNDIDLATVTESWLTAENNSVTAVIKDYGYELLHVYRADRRGRGVAILYKNSLVIKPVKDRLSVESFEYYCCGLKLTKDLDVKIICHHRAGSPNSGASNFINELEAVIGKHYGPNDVCIITGDFNNYYELDNSSKNYLWSSTSSFGLEQLVPCTPTHVDGHTLDLLFANTGQIDIKVHTVECPFTPPDHFPIKFDICNVSGERKPNFGNIIKLISTAN